MKSFLISILLLIGIGTVQAQLSTTPPPASATPSDDSTAEKTGKKIELSSADPVAQKSLEDFLQLPKAKQDEFYKLLDAGQKLIADKRIPEALEKLNTAEAIWAKNPTLLNLKGSALVNLRDFDRAASYFDQCVKYYPEYWQANFNAAEMSFVRKKYDAAEKQFTFLYNDEKTIDPQTRKLIEYKLILTKIKLKKLDEAKKWLAKYDIFDDSPLFYYGNAALHFEQNDRKKAEEWITNARAVYSPQMTAIYEDSLTELGWLYVF